MRCAGLSCSLQSYFTPWFVSQTSAKKSSPWPPPAWRGTSPQGGQDKLYTHVRNAPKATINLLVMSTSGDILPALGRSCYNMQVLRDILGKKTDVRKSKKIIKPQKGACWSQDQHGQGVSFGLCVTNRG